MYSRQVSSFREKLKTRILKPEEGREKRGQSAFSLAPVWSRGQRGEPPPPLTRSLVFDEEKLQTLLEGVFIHVKLHLDPDRREKRQRVRRRSAVCVSNDLPCGFGDGLSLGLCSKINQQGPCRRTTITRKASVMRSAASCHI